MTMPRNGSTVRIDQLSEMSRLPEMWSIIRNLFVVKAERRCNDQNVIVLEWGSRKAIDTTIPNAARANLKALISLGRNIIFAYLCEISQLTKDNITIKLRKFQDFWTINNQVMIEFTCSPTAIWTITLNRPSFLSILSRYFISSHSWVHWKLSLNWCIQNQFQRLNC